MRDPYTAGYRRRVAELADVIRQLPGRDAQSMRSMQMAATLHDIGKIVVPVDILAKPGRLTDKAFELIEEHSRAVYVLESIPPGSTCVEPQLRCFLRGSGHL
jgi:HD-GYP domain-containing protein (c-di-GMP phosphodiesterase class II)